MQYRLVQDGVADTLDGSILLSDDIYAMPEVFHDFKPVSSPIGTKPVRLDGLLDLMKDQKVGSIVRADLRGLDGENITTNKLGDVVKELDKGANLVALSYVLKISIPIIMTLFASGRVSMPSTVPPELRIQALRSVLKFVVKSAVK